MNGALLDFVEARFKKGVLSGTKRYNLERLLNSQLTDGITGVKGLPLRALRRKENDMGVVWNPESFGVGYHAFSRTALRSDLLFHGIGNLMKGTSGGSREVAKSYHPTYRTLPRCNYYVIWEFSISVSYGHNTMPFRPEDVSIWLIPNSFEFRSRCFARWRNHKAKNTTKDDICQTWLAVSFWNITIAKESRSNVKEIHGLLDEAARGIE